jgi:hypothetical protein
LLEVLIALGILGTAMVAVSGAIDSSARRVLAARENLVAGRLAQAKLHEVLSSREMTEEEGVSEFHPAYHWRVRLKEEEFHLGKLDFAPKTQRVEVLVTWRGGARRLSLVSRRQEKIEGARR